MLWRRLQRRRNLRNGATQQRDRANRITLRRGEPRPRIAGRLAELRTVASRPGSLAEDLPRPANISVGAYEPVVRVGRCAGDLASFAVHNGLVASQHLSHRAKTFLVCLVCLHPRKDLGLLLIVVSLRNQFVIKHFLELLQYRDGGDQHDVEVGLRYLPVVFLVRVSLPVKN